MKKPVKLSKPAFGDTFVPQISIEAFGKDHWSTFGYAECRIVDHEGFPHWPHMRCYPKRHPQFAHCSWTEDGARETNATRIRGLIVPYHDDWDCIEDLVRAKLLEDIGTGVNPCWRLTELGAQVAAQLRRWKGEGGTFATFVPVLP